MERQLFSFFENGALCMHAGMFVKKPLSAVRLHLLPPKLGEGNVRCLQIQYDRLDTANLSFHVKTSQ